MPDIAIHNPAALGKPLGQYSHITRVKASEFLFIAGQVATDNSGKPIGVNDFDAQCRQVSPNIEAGLKSQGAGFANIFEFTTYLVHSQDIANFMSFRSRKFPRMFPGGQYPPNTLLIIDRRARAGVLIEVQTVAALWPDSPPLLHVFERTCPCRIIASSPHRRRCIGASLMPALYRSSRLRAERASPSLASRAVPR